ncbi:MAG: DegT/DnrJ/EryC1/StrS family aminotransferase, partial [archaeon]
IPIAQSVEAGNEMKYLREVLDAQWLGSGTFVERFEKAFADYCGVKYACAVSNGTNALYLVYKMLDIRAGDEIIVPDVTFITPASMAVHAGARPVLVDVQEDTFNIDPRQVEKAITPKTKAIVPVDLLGHPADYDELNEIGKKHGIPVIENGAEAHGAQYRGKKVGSLAPISMFSFYGNKTIATGEGGMILSDDKEFIDKCILSRAHGMRPEKRYWHEVMGYNYRMTDLQAAVGVAQLEKIDEFLAGKKAVAKRYEERLGNIPGIQLPAEREYARHSYWMYQINVTKEFPITRDDLAVELKKRNIDSRRAFFPIHLQPAYRVEGRFPISDACSETGIMLPTGVRMKMETVDRVCDAIAEIRKESE